MRFARLSLIFLFAALVLNKTSFGALLLTANYSLRAEAEDRKLLTNGQIVVVPGGVALDVNPGPFNFTPEAIAEHGDGVASVFATVRAEKANVGIGFDGSIFSSGGPIMGGVITGASGGRINATATAGWMEFIVPKLKNRPTGQAFIFNSLIILDGSFGADITGGTHNLPGSVHSYLDYSEDSTNSTVLDPPAGGPSWGSFHASPGDNRYEINLPPEIIHVKHIMFNGQPYTLNNSMRLSTDADAANGGTTSFVTDFSASLKWGGIDSVTDTDGNLIPGDEWSIESESGFDYAKSWDAQVPEPTGILLIGLGMFGVVLRRRVLS